MEIKKQNPYPAKISDVLTDDYSKAGKNTKKIFKQVCLDYVKKKEEGASPEELRAFWIKNLNSEYSNFV